MSDSADEHFDIQALLRGFGDAWPWALFAYGTLGDDPARNCKFLRDLPMALGNTKGPTSVKELDARENDTAFDSPFNVAFTHAGLSKLGLAPDVLSSFPPEYVQGMRRRAYTNHDRGRSDPEFWEKHWRDGGVDVWIGIYARSEEVRERQHQKLKEHFQKFDVAPGGFDLAYRVVAGETPVWIDDEQRQPEPSKALEHFGFEDGISNPPIKGLAPAGLVASGKIDKAGRWQQLAAGEFLYGHLDEIGEVPVGPTPAGIAANGTYMVLRKLAQDVGAFRDYVSRSAGSYGMSADALAEKLVGRSRNGNALVARPPEGDRNDFRFGDDKQGMICPLGSHVRRVNPRDTLGSESLMVDRHRVLRRAITYGSLVPRGRDQGAVNPLQPGDNGDDPYPGQGLLFIGLNIDIKRQFEFIQSQWVNFGNDLDQGSDRDPLAGFHNQRHPKHNRFVLLTDSREGVVVCAELPQFVLTRGGDYFFLPGLRAYHGIVNNKYY